MLREADGPLFLSPFVLAELDYLITKLAGVDVEIEFLHEVVREAYELVPFLAADVEQAMSIIEQHRDRAIGLADASIVVLSRRYQTLDLLSLDERHFRVLRGARGRSFRLLPADG